MKTLIALSFLLAIFSTSMTTDSRLIEYRIEERSKLFIEGSSNINRFKCHCDQHFQKQALTVLPHSDGKRLKFEKATLVVPSKSLDCGQSGINKDMYNTLKADQYPNIEITLTGLKFHDDRRLLNSNHKLWVSMDAEVHLTIAGVTKKTIFTACARQTNSNQYHLTAEHDILLSHFNLRPPAPMMGLIKVNDKITFNLDLIVSILQS